MSEKPFYIKKQDFFRLFKKKYKNPTAVLNISLKRSDIPTITNDSGELLIHANSGEGYKEASKRIAKRVWDDLLSGKIDIEEAKRQSEDIREGRESEFVLSSSTGEASAIEHFSTLTAPVYEDPSKIEVTPEESFKIYKSDNQDVVLKKIKAKKEWLDTILKEGEVDRRNGELLHVDISKELINTTFKVLLDKFRIEAQNMINEISAQHDIDKEDKAVYTESLHGGIDIIFKETKELVFLDMKKIVNEFKAKSSAQAAKT